MNETFDNRLDIILVNYNSTDHLSACLESIFNNLGDIPARVIVEDNDSRDGVGRIPEKFPSVELIENRINLGFARAVNKSLKSCTAPYALILNPDTHVSNGFFSPLIEYMEAHPAVGVLGPAVLNEDGSLQGSARSYPSPLTAVFGRSSILSKWFPNNPLTCQNLLTTRSDGLTPMEVDWVSGACMLVRRRAMAEVGLLDERFFMYWEDADWCRRFWKRGWKVVYFPRVSIIHYLGVSSTKNPFRSALEFHKSSYRLFGKYARPSLLPLKPLVIGGLSLRVLPILISGAIQAISGRKRAKRNKVIATLPRDGRITVLRMIARLNIGGPAIHVHLLARGLDGDRFETTVVSGKIPAQEGDMGYLFGPTDKQPLIIPYLQREISMATDLRALVRIYRILQRLKPDIVHSHTAKAGFNARLAVAAYNLLNRKKIKVVHTFHGHVFSGYFSSFKSDLFVWIERLLAKVTDVIVAISESQRRELVESYRIAPPEKIRVVNLGFDLAPFLTCHKRRGELRRRLGIDEETLLIGIVGRLVPIKNHKMFFDAARLLLKDCNTRPIRFIVAGDGELREELEAYCDELGLSDVTHFCGWVQDAPMIYADLDILALTSKNEGTPVSIIEAMASSVLVISTNAGGVQDLLGCGSALSFHNGLEVAERGVLCDKGDGGAFARGLRYLSDLDDASRAERLEAARSYVEKVFSEQRLLKDIETLYMNITHRH